MTTTITTNSIELARANAEARDKHLAHKADCEQCRIGDQYCEEGRQLINKLLETRMALGYGDIRRVG